MHTSTFWDFCIFYFGGGKLEFRKQIGVNLSGNLECLFFGKVVCHKWQSGVMLFGKLVFHHSNLECCFWQIGVSRWQSGVMLFGRLVCHTLQFGVSQWQIGVFEKDFFFFLINFLIPTTNETKTYFILFFLLYDWIFLIFSFIFSTNLL